MGSQHSKTQAKGASRRPVSSPNAGNKTPAPTKQPSVIRQASSTIIGEEEQQIQISRSSSASSSSSTSQSQQMKTIEPTATTNKLGPVPSKVKKFRVKVPQSMVPGDIMTIKLGGMLTKIKITTPTTTSTSTIATSKRVTSDGYADDASNKADDPSSRAATSTSCSDASSSSSHTSPSSSNTPPSPAPKRRNLADSVIASTDAEVPKGKMIVDAKSVLVVHAVFSSELYQGRKDDMIDEVMRLILQETADCGCNALLGMTVTIKKQQITENTSGASSSSDYLIKACGTPCLLMPSQVLLSSTATTPASATTLLRGAFPPSSSAGLRSQ